MLRFHGWTRRPPEPFVPIRRVIRPDRAGAPGRCMLGLLDARSHRRGHEREPARVSGALRSLGASLLPQFPHTLLTTTTAVAVLGRRVAVAIFP